jgi:hypothetical protein
MEDLVDKCCEAMQQAKPTTKPKPRERDGVLQKAAHQPRETRDAIVGLLPSFKRLVNVVRAFLTTLDVMDA